MNKADKIFLRNIEDIMENGVMSQQARPKYKDGTVANSKYITGVFDSYDLSKGEFPITSLRRIPIKAAIKELFWIYQDQSNDLKLLKEKYNVKYWDDWEVNNSGTIGQRYGATVKRYNIIDNLLKGLEENPFNRRNVINLWQYNDFEETDGLKPCAFQCMFDVRPIGDEMYLDLTLVQRSNDFLVAHHINAMQYVALQLMVACHFGWKVGKFNYLINNLHIYDNQFEHAQELLLRGSELRLSEIMHLNGERCCTPIGTSPRLVLNAKPGTNFYDIKPEDFVMEDYKPIEPQLKFDLAI